MSTLSPVQQTDPRANELARQVVDTYNQQGGAAAARKLRELTNDPQLSAAQKKEVYQGAEPVVADIASDLGKNAHTDFGKTPGTAGSGPIDTQPEYDQTMEDMGAVFKLTGDSGAARAFGKDVLDGLAAPAVDKQDPLAALGHFGDGLELGLKKNNTQVLADSVAFSLHNAGDSKTGVYALDAGSRQSLVTDLLKQVDETKVNDATYVVDPGDTMWDVAARGDVQATVLTPAELDQAKTEHWGRDQLTRTTLDRIEADNGYSRPLDDGRVTDQKGDPDLLNIGDRLTLVNRSGQTLSPDLAGTGADPAAFGDAATPATQAHTLATANARNPFEALAQFQKFSATMTPAQKSALVAEMLKQPDANWNAPLLGAMGFSNGTTVTHSDFTTNFAAPGTPIAPPLLAETGVDGAGKSTGLSNLQALYRAYAATGGDPAKFVDYVNDAARAGGDKLKTLCRQAQEKS
jgi:hypothetical protein